jgi:salicylate hydroxylase
MAHDHFTIIGGGIAGLASGLALAKMGATASLFEQASTFGEVGAGLQIGPNAVRALEALGAWDAVSPSTYAPPAIIIRDGRTGKLLQEVELGRAFTARFGQPYRVAHRADLHEGLLAALNVQRLVDMNLGHTLAAGDTKGEVIAADGINSPTRLSLFPETIAVRLPMKINRALLSMPVLHGVALDCVNLWLYPQGHVVHYPVSGGKKFNLVAVTPETAPADHFAGAAPELRSLLALVPHWLEWTAAYVPPLPAWGQGKVRLIGDAAHATLPFLAQGAAMALEDAVALAKTKANLTDYEAMRRARVTRLHQETLRAGEIYHLAGLKAAARNMGLMAMPQSLFLRRLAWIYEGC